MVAMIIAIRATWKVAVTVVAMKLVAVITIVRMRRMVAHLLSTPNLPSRRKYERKNNESRSDERRRNEK